MSTADDDLQLLLVHADEHDPFLPDGLRPTPPESPPRRDERDENEPVYLFDDGADPNDLAEQRWGLIVPEGPRGDRRYARLDPLVRARTAEQGGKPVRVFRVPAVMDQDAAANWRRDVLDRGNDLGVDIPRYLLLAGDLDEVPLSLQQILAADSFVGRIAFDDERDYERYAEKVLRFEASPSAESQARALFHTVHDGSAATRVGHAGLVAPGLELVRGRQGARFPARDIRHLGHEHDPSPDDLLGTVQTSHPSVLLSVSHGMGSPRSGWASPDEQRQRQGAMSFGQGRYLEAGDLRETPFLPGGMWFMLACFGAGTPDSSAYHPWLARLRDAGRYRGQLDPLLRSLPRAEDRPFIAALPKAILANPNGPLSMIGHIDLAWSYAFRELDRGKAIDRPGRYMRVLAQMCRGRRAGVAFHALYRSFAQISLQISAQHEERTDRRGRRGPSLDPTQYAHLWMLRQDLAGYVLLGDPAARLALAPADTEGEHAAQTGTATPPPESVRADPPASRVDRDRLEEAIAAAMLGERGTRALARELGVERSELERWIDAYRQAGRAALGI